MYFSLCCVLCEMLVFVSGVCWVVLRALYISPFLMSSLLAVAYVVRLVCGFPSNV